MSSNQARLAQSQITSWASKDGSFKRLPSSFRNHIEAAGQFAPEANRYHLYVSTACPWAHRTLIVRKLKGMDADPTLLPVSIVHPHMGALGWSFGCPLRGEDGSYPATTGETGPEDGIANVTGDQVYGSKFIRELYFKANPEYEGRFTVPILWDTKHQTIVNNESSEIIRMLNTEFNSILPPKFAEVDLYPEQLRSEIDAQNEWVYDTVNNGVYKSGFATGKEPYEQSVQQLFASLDRLEKILEGKTFVVGSQLTEADVRLFTTIIRFDPVYVGHFKCNIGTIRHSYPNLNRWAKSLFWGNDAFGSTTDFVHIKHHYYTSHPQINPTRIVPFGPLPNIEK